MHNPIGQLLAAKELIILDGALATELERRGADLNDPLWSAKCLLEQPQLIRAVHRDYFDAGADIATSATYQATFEGFGRRGIDRAAGAQLMRQAVALALDARDEFWAGREPDCTRPRPLVAASIGPFGALLADGSEYRGHYGVSERTLAEFHLPRLEVLVESGADLLACETIPCLREALILARLLEQFPETTAWVSFSCRDGAHNCEGQDIAQCAASLAGHPQIAAVGVNCTRPRYVADLLERMRGQTGQPLIAYPNSGERYDASAKRWTDVPMDSSPDLPFAEQARVWYRAGARLIGGCCRTTPNDIRSLGGL